MNTTSSTSTLGPTPVPNAAEPPAAPDGAPGDHKDHTVGATNPLAQRIWDHVAHTPLHNMWDFEGTPPTVIMKRTAASFMSDNLLSRAAELGYYFLFALFPTLVSASSILGLVAKSATHMYVNLLNYLALVVPQSAYQLVIQTFNQTTQASTGGKITLGLAAALWSASVGFTAIQDTLNTVYKVKETRPYWKARGSAILVTVLLSLIVTLNLVALFGGDLGAKFAEHTIPNHSTGLMVGWALRIGSFGLACAFLLLLFSTIYYFAPDLKNKRWHWITPGAAIGCAAWLIASIGLRVYLHYFDSYSVTYGSLGAVIILLTWFYITGVTLLGGAEINSEIQAAVTEKRLKEQGVVPEHASTNPEHPVQAAA